MRNLWASRNISNFTNFSQLGKNNFDKKRKDIHNLSYNSLHLFRWAPSHLLSIQRISTKYDTLVDHLEEIASFESEFSDVAKEKADNLREVLLDENFLALMFIHMDILSQVAIQSLAYQKRGSTFINEYDREQVFINGLKVLQKKKGSHLTEFLKEARCTDSEAEMDDYLDSFGAHELPSCKTLDIYENSLHKAYKGHKLSPRDSEYAKVSSFLKLYIDEVINLHEEYFTKHSPIMTLFRTFAPKHWKKRMPRDEPKKVLELAKLLGVSSTVFNIQDEWTKFRNDVVESQYFCGSSNDLVTKPEEFWTKILNAKSIYVPRIIRKLLERILVIPLGSR